MLLTPSVFATLQFVLKRASILIHEYYAKVSF